jgi:uncharacterized paraquat-inducible protein A
VTSISIAPLLFAAAALVVVAAAVVVLVAVLGARSRAAAMPEAPARPSSPTAIVCSFCKQEYEPAESAGRCPSCGAAAPRS